MLKPETVWGDRGYPRTFLVLTDIDIDRLPKSKVLYTVEKLILSSIEWFDVMSNSSIVTGPNVGPPQKNIEKIPGLLAHPPQLH